MISAVIDAATQLADRFCESCGYNLRGLDECRCPECGSEFDPNAPPIARIPWLRRSEIGTWRAYWQTVFAVTFHPIRFARETAKPGPMRAEDADRFRRLIIWQGAVSVALFHASLILAEGPQGLARRLLAA